MASIVASFVVPIVLEQGKKTIKKYSKNKNLKMESSSSTPRDLGASTSAKQDLVEEGVAISVSLAKGIKKALGKTKGKNMDGGVRNTANNKTRIQALKVRVMDTVDKCMGTANSQIIPMVILEEGKFDGYMSQHGGHYQNPNGGYPNDNNHYIDHGNPRKPDHDQHQQSRGPDSDVHKHNGGYRGGVDSSHLHERQFDPQSSGVIDTAHIRGKHRVRSSHLGSRESDSEEDSSDSEDNDDDDRKPRPLFDANGHDNPAAKKRMS
ncbi:hypothetical protein DL98DRAFT_626328 [Cadophora sp. DSE1049]|nr:hypothetical protein DL98DRAFT_626328 [Cadophora sp. DSE1049]